MTYETAERAAFLGRLIPTTVSAKTPRLTIPDRIVPSHKEQEFVFIFSLGYPELWFSESSLSYGE